MGSVISVTVFTGIDNDFLLFVFTDEKEAHEFDRHVRDLYKLRTEVLVHSIDTYDSAIGALVEAIGPSSD
jgi:hypothetical protein